MTRFLEMRWPYYFGAAATQISGTYKKRDGGEVPHILQD